MQRVWKLHRGIKKIKITYYPHHQVKIPESILVYLHLVFFSWKYDMYFPKLGLCYLKICCALLLTIFEDTIFKDWIIFYHSLFLLLGILLFYHFAVLNNTATHTENKAIAGIYDWLLNGTYWIKWCGQPHWYLILHGILCFSLLFFSDLSL